MNSRDNFSKSTVDTLSRRAGHLCSNPSCRKHTSGPNSNDNKSTTIGEAAHITAAAPGGPRYDNSLSSSERSHINNGIWLCSNCASLIDKDEAAYPADLLKLWKARAEFEMSSALSGSHQPNLAKREIPIIEAELIPGSTIGGPVDYSQLYQLDWRLKLIIRNNSNFPAYHLKLDFGGSTKIRLNNSPTRANLAPLGEWVLETSTQLQFQGDGLTADSYLRSRLPRHLNGMSFKICYKDEARNDYSTLVTIKDDETINVLNR